MKIRIGRVEWSFAVLLLAYILLSFVPGLGPLQFLVKVAAATVGGWVFARVTRNIVQGLLWRLRNRLIVAYVFIALVPVVLITILAGLGASFLGGQLTIYLVTAELERRNEALRGTIDFLAQSDAGDRVDWAERVAPILERANPGIQLSIRDGSTWTYPADADISQMPENWTEGSGLLLRRGLLYGWAHTVRRNRKVTALVPITREYLGMLAPDICESTIMDVRSGRTYLHPTIVQTEPSHNRFPPAVNRLDFEIGWGGPLPVNDWESPNRIENKWLTIRTRPSALLRTIFSQKVDWASDVVPLVFFMVAIAFLIAEIIALIIGVSLTKTITGAIHGLYEGTLRVRGSDFSHRIPIRGKDQLTELAVSFNQMTENMQRLLKVEKERERLQAELEIAREVQGQLFPRTLPQVQNLCMAGACQPARMVSGDYYDYQQVGDDKVAIAIGDVAGKGISAALLMATVQSSFRSQLRFSLGSSPISTSAVVDHLNQQLFCDTAPEKYATFYLGLYDDATSTLTYTNAGHLPPILIRDGTSERLEVNGMVVGAFPFAKYGQSVLHLRSGDLVVFFTDGISEPESIYGEMFGEDRLVDLLVRNAHLEDKKLIQTVLDCVRDWTGSDELQDDMTILVVRRR